MPDAVAADQRDALAGLDLEIGVLEERQMAEGEADALVGSGGAEDYGHVLRATCATCYVLRAGAHARMRDPRAFVLCVNGGHFARLIDKSTVTPCNC